MNKKQFQSQYLKLTQEDKNKVKEFHENQLKNAIFVDTFETAEKCLLWIREIERWENTTTTQQSHIIF